MPSVSALRKMIRDVGDHLAECEWALIADQELVYGFSSSQIERIEERIDELYNELAELRFELRQAIALRKQLKKQRRAALKK